MARHHMMYILFLLTREAISANKFKDQNVLRILEVLLKVFALN